MTEKPVAGRIPLLERDQVSPEIAGVYDVLLQERGVVPNMFKTLAHTPGLALGVAGFLKSRLGNNALPVWYKELVATRMSVFNNSQDAISAHTLSAKQKGASDEQIAAVKGDFQKGPFTGAEKLAFLCANRLHHSGRELDDDLFRRLKEVFSDAQIIELIVTAAAFEIFPLLIDGLGLPITPPPKPGS